MCRIVPSLAALLLAACGGPPFVLTATAETFCHRLPAQRFVVPDGVPMAQPVEISRTFDFDVSNAPAAAGLSTQLTLEHVKLARADGTLDFLSHAAVTLQPPAASSLSAPSLAVNRIPQGASAVSVAGKDVDIAPYLVGGLLRYAVALGGTLPARTVTLDVEACASVTASLDTVTLLNANLP